MKPWFLKLLRAVWTLASAGMVVDWLARPEWHVRMPQGHESSNRAWLFAGPEQPFGRDHIEWGTSLLMAAGVIACAALTWWIITHDLRRAEARAQAAKAEGATSAA
jgi:hypothetical protein